MPRHRPQLLAPFALGLFVLAWGAACLGFAEAREARSVAFSQQSHDDVVLMSCDQTPSSSDEPLWCENPDSPHCQPGSDAPSSREISVGPSTAAHAEPMATAAPWSSDLPDWSPPLAAERAMESHAGRLERPPRRS